MSVQALLFPTVQALIAVNHGSADRAVELLRPAEPYAATNSILLYVRANAHLQRARERHEKGYSHECGFQEITKVTR
jgi:hypothetical protein